MGIGGNVAKHIELDKQLLQWVQADRRLQELRKQFEKARSDVALQEGEVLKLVSKIQGMNAVDEKNRERFVKVVIATQPGDAIEGTETVTVEMNWVDGRISLRMVNLEG
jgi:hypothetical protein